MISLDWKERLVSDSIDYFERKLPKGDFDFDIIYNAYPARVENKIPREVVTLVADTLATKMQKNHKDYVKFCDYIWKHKGENGRVAFICVMSKFIKKDQASYYEYTKKYLCTLENPLDIAMVIDKIYLPIFKKNPIEHIDSLINWLKEGNEKVNQHLIRTILKLGKTNADFLKKFTDKLENRWLNATPEFAKMSGTFLKCLGKLDEKLYLDFYKNYRSTREPIFVEILTMGLMMYTDFLLEIYENWSKSGNARLKKAAVTGFKYLNKKKK